MHRAAGGDRWRFELGELEGILQDVEQSRLMELEEINDGLFA
jgi:hypothetical protein